MLDKVLIRTVRQIVLDGLAAQSITASVKQAYQPTQQGANTAPTVYLFKIGDRRHGSPRRRTVTTRTSLKWGQAGLKWGGRKTVNKWGGTGLKWGQSGLKWGTPLSDAGHRWGEVNETTAHDETQQYETTFQVNALVAQSPSDETGMTASDLVNMVAAILQSESAIAALRLQGIGILRVTDVRNPYFENDRGQREASTSFDFVLTHKQIVATSVPLVAITEYNIQRV